MTAIFTKRAAALAGAAAISLTLGSAAHADQVFVDDVIVQGSLCVGVDCVNGEFFSFDTIVMKENNTRLAFTDTSTGSFPTNDWTIVANDSANGGANYLAFQDDDAGRVPFRVDAGAPNNTLRVTSAGRIGVGTGTPVMNIHVATGNTPALRLDQNTSSGFASQVWDIAGNEANFFIRDATNGSSLPFRIEPGAPQNALYVENTGHIGLGTDNPLGRIHVRGDGSQRQMFLLEQTTAGTNWVIANYETGAGEGAGNFGINLVGGGNMFRIDASGNVYFPNLSNCTNGVRTDAAGQLSCAP